MKKVQVSRWKLGSVGRALLIAGALGPLAGCGGGNSQPGVGITNVSESAPRLADTTTTGQYSPYYGTGDLERPRYFHQAIHNKKGQPIIFGGSDERGYAGLDTAEIFDQSTFEKDVPRPPSLVGVWIDTNFEGDPIAFENGPRMHHTLDLLADGRVIMVGGSTDLLRSGLYEQVEVFDPETRTFETLENKMVLPRFRHTSVPQNDGSILFIGGQIAATVTIINDQIPEGIPGRETQETRFITTPLCELYLPKENSFVEHTFPETDVASKLNTPRGRADHATVRMAGPDQALGNADDVFLIAGGYQSFTGRFSPVNKFQYTVAAGRATGLQVLEFYDPITRAFTQVNNVSLDSVRMNSPYLLNLGKFNDFTLDGVRGMGNVVLATHGNSDDFCPVTVLGSMVITATYTGFGPAQGIQFFSIIEDQFRSRFEGGEYPPPPPAYDPRANLLGRSATNPVLLPRAMLTNPNVADVESWVFSTAGVDIFPTPAGCAFNYQSATMLAGTMFDPFFNLPAVQLGLSTRDLRSQRTQNNPTGIVGAWLTLDGALPTTDLTNYRSTLQSARWARRVAPRRVWTRNIAVAGEDGIIDTADDRVLLAGGGIEYGSGADIGGEPTAPSCEIFIVPGSNVKTPSP